MTYDEAEVILMLQYSDTWANDDPDWWQEMIDAIRECDTKETALQFLATGRMP